MAVNGKGAVVVTGVDVSPVNNARLQSATLVNMRIKAGVHGPASYLCAKRDVADRPSGSPSSVVQHVHATTADEVYVSVVPEDIATSTPKTNTAAASIGGSNQTSIDV